MPICSSSIFHGWYPKLTLPTLYKAHPVSPWGDYGQILVHGTTTHAPRRADGLIPLERTGPFVPPITLPWELIVTPAARSSLESAGLAGLSFATVHKTRIVHSDWHTWDLGSPQPRAHPESGEPEDYVLVPPHDAALAKVMPALFAVLPLGRARIEKRDPPPVDPSIPEWVTITAPGSSKSMRIRNPEWRAAQWPVLTVIEHDGSDVALAPPYEFPIFSERARIALTSRWVEFTPMAREG